MHTVQDNYVGDIGDYGKYGLLREVSAEAITLSINWYRVFSKTKTRQNDGKFIKYLAEPQRYREYDPVLFDWLQNVVNVEQDRRIERIEQEQIVSAAYFSEIIDAQRTKWHQRALEATGGADVVFLDPDNGLETAHMYQTNAATEKHVRWGELKDYYTRGQNVIVYQHRPQMTSKEKCIENMMHVQNNYLFSDCIRILEFPKCTNRFYAMFVHKNYEIAFERICASMSRKWGKDNFCREVILR